MCLLNKYKSIDQSQSIGLDNIRPLNLENTPVRWELEAQFVLVTLWDGLVVYIIYLF